MYVLFNIARIFKMSRDCFEQSRWTGPNNLMSNCRYHKHKYLYNVMLYFGSIKLSGEVYPVTEWSSLVTWFNKQHHLVCDRIQVTVSGTETKVQFWYRSRNIFSETETFFFIFFSNFLMFFSFLEGYRFLKA